MLRTFLTSSCRKKSRKLEKPLKDKVSTIRSSLEKILKTIIIKIENGDQISVANELKWFDDLVFDIYNLKKTNSVLFQEIIDPLNRHRIIKHNDLSKID